MFKLIKSLFSLLIVLVILGGLIYGYSKYIEPFLLAASEETISSPLINQNADGLKIGFFADTHFGEFYNTEDFQSVINIFNEAQPDIIIFGGDLIDIYNSFDGSTDEITEKLSALEAPLGKFAVFGNHDYGGGAHRVYEDIMEASGFQVLVNGYISVDEYNIGIVGLDEYIFGSKDLSVGSWARDDYFNIFVCHEPDVIDQMLNYNIDLMLAGHTHGGQIHIPGYTKKFLPPYGEKYLKGTFDFDNQRKSKLYVTPGVGMTKLGLRFMSRPEVGLITLKSGAQIGE